MCGFMQADKIDQDLRRSDNLIVSTVRLVLMHRLCLFLIIILLGLLDGGLIYYKLFVR